MVEGTLYKFCNVAIGGRSQTMLTRRGRYLGRTGNVNSMYEDFPLYKYVDEFLHTCQPQCSIICGQPGVGRWSKKVKILST